MMPVVPLLCIAAFIGKVAALGSQISFQTSYQTSFAHYVGNRCPADYSMSNEEIPAYESLLEESPTRRRLLCSAIIGTFTVSVSSISPQYALAVDLQIGASPERPVAVLGAGGKTGLNVAQALANQGVYTVTMTRTGRDPFKLASLRPEVQSYIQHYPSQVDVIQKEPLMEALKKARASAIIYCASASPHGGTALEVDGIGVGNAAEAARDLQARFVLISAVAVDQPNSKSYQATNALGGNLDGMMEAKLAGENKVREMLKRSKNYVIVRPGVFMRGTTRRGPLDMEINQGDTIGGGITRDEVAGVAVGGLLSGKRGVTVEVYRRSTATKLLPGLDMPSGREAYGDTYASLFDSVEHDK